MSESSLSVGLPELRQEVGFFLNYGRGVSPAWSAGQLAELNGLVQSGVRRVYYPPAMRIQPDIAGYEWSWLRPSKTLPIVANDGDYDLPDDFGRLSGEINYPAASYLSPIAIISASRLEAKRASSDLSGKPVYAAVRYKASTGASGQRQEILFYPKPDQAFSLTYEYEAYSGALSDSFPYPLGGMQLAELYIESCLAVAESRVTDEPGNHQQQYELLLIDAIARDRKRGARFFGPMGHKQNSNETFHRGCTGDVYPITYKGELI